MNARHFDQLIGRWRALASALPDRRTDGQPLQLFSAVSHRLRLTLAQVPIQEKSNEIPALPALLRSLPSLASTLITADAIHCQRESARVITQELGGDYLFGLKGNQSGVLERAERLLAPQAFPPDATVEWEKGHHRLDRRRLKRVTVSPEEIGLCGCWQVLAVRRERVELGRQAKPPSDEIGYYVTSVGAKEYSDQELLEAIRGHWSAIENGAHYRRDVSFGEDASGVSKRGAAQVMACLRNLALGIYELARERGRTQAPSARACGRQMTFAAALSELRR